MNIYYYPHLAGGAEISVMKLAEELAKDPANQVEVLCIAEEGCPKEEQIRGVNVFRMSLNGMNGNRLKTRINRVFNITDYRRIYQFLKDHKPDVIHTNNLRSFTVSIWKAAHQLNLPVIHSLRDYVLLDMYRYKIEKCIIQHYSNCVTAISAPSTFTLNQHLQANLFSKAHVKRTVVNAIDFDIEYTKKQMDAKKQKRIELGHDIQFAYIGRYSEEKGIDWLIHVFEKSSEKQILHLFGGGVLKDETENILARQARIINHGMLQEAELNKALRDIDVVIVPSLWEEPFGRVILDAFKSGSPVIVTKRGGLAENVVHEKSGLLIEPDDEELMNAMEKIKMPGIIDEMCEEILKVLPLYSVQQQAKTFMSIYEEVRK